ncbi:LOW QUALITY PROTEIN: uncharacterized protein [Amphiura filiformis]|uniref:LOW QUALITY PROTEIN: uncharacterized protein n=1 Tax=Amphiura filiformis TaxID=82378 RepID=UPI003B225C08
MPMIQTPQWTEFLSCPVCYHEFNENIRRPISLGCGHTVCKTCLSQLQRKQCPFDQSPITQDIDDLPANYALLQLVGAEVTVEEQKIPANVVSKYMKHYAEAKACIEELALYLKPLGVGGAGSSNCILSRPMQRKLVTQINCQLVEEERRSRAMRAARSIGERTVTELMLQHQNTQQLSANLWAAVRARGCQFLGPAMQEETLKLVLLALEDGAALSRKVLVMFVVQKLEQQFPQASKTSVGHVVQLLYRASCFKVTKREEESSLMQLKEEFRNYEALRREHDAQIVQIAMEGGLRISPEQWSSLLYGDLNHKSHMQSIIDKLQTPASFTSSIQELTIALQRSGDPANLGKLRDHLKLLANINPIPELELPAWEDVEYAMISTKIVVHGLVEFISHHSHTKKILEQQQTQNIKYKTSMCRDITQKGGCPRGNNCTFAHCEDELDKYRSKSRRLLSTINRQNSNQSVRSTMSQSSMIGGRMLSRGMSSPPLDKYINTAAIVDPEADDGLINERKMTRDAVLGYSPHHGVISPEPDERPGKYPPHAMGDMQVPYRPPDHYDQYGRDRHGYPTGMPPTPSTPPPHPSSTTQYGRMLHGVPKDQYITKPPVYRHQDSGDDYMHPPHVINRESHPSPLHYEGVRRVPDHPGPMLRYPSPLHSDHDTDRYHHGHLLSDKSDGFQEDLSAFSRHDNGWTKSEELEYPLQDLERNEKAHDKTKMRPFLNSIETPANIPTNLVELQQRQKEIVAKLNDYQVKSPWEHSALTTVVSSNQGRPKSSVVIDEARRRPAHTTSRHSSYDATHGYKYFDPWTSTAPFVFFKPVKELNTKYTMTVSKSQIKHVSANETEQMALEKPHQGKEHPEFTNMDLAELKKTLEKVKLQDHHTGCTHFERSQELNQELKRREHCGRPDLPCTDPSHHVVSPFIQEEYIPQIWGPPVSRASRTSFKITPPVKVNAGPTGPGGGAPCTPVSFNWNNQMVPVAGQSPVADKNLDMNMFHRDTINREDIPRDNVPRGDIPRDTVPRDEPRDAVTRDAIHRDAIHKDAIHRESIHREAVIVTSVEQRNESGNPVKTQLELEHELAQVKTKIAQQKTAKTANDAFLIQRESRALGETRLSMPPPDITHLQVQKDMEIAKRLQSEEFKGARPLSPDSPNTFTMDQDFPPLDRDILENQARDKRLLIHEQQARDIRLSQEQQAREKRLLQEQQARDKKLAEQVHRYEQERAQRFEQEKAMRMRSYNQRRPRYDDDMLHQGHAQQYQQQWQQQQQSHQQQQQSHQQRYQEQQIRQQQEQEDQMLARQVARDEARAIGVRLPPENKGYRGGASAYPWPK